jgi:hypothetical protein
MKEDADNRYDEMAQYLKGLSERWADLPLRSPESYVDRNYDALKLVGAGNATGVIALSAFITSATRSVGAINAGKACLLVFAVGVATFAVAYFFLYHWSHQMEHARQRLAQKKDLQEESFNRQTKVAAKSYYEAGRWAAISIGCFSIGFVMAILGVLIVR